MTLLPSSLNKLRHLPSQPLRRAKFLLPFSGHDVLAQKSQALRSPHQLFDKMPERVVSAIIRAVRDLGSEDLSRVVHGLAVKGGCGLRADVATSLIGFYSSVGNLESAKRLFGLVQGKDVILWSSMVTAFCKNGRFSVAIGTFCAMKGSCICPNAVSLLSVLVACTNAGALSQGRQIHGFALTSGCSETSLQNSLIDMYVKCGELKAAMLVFDRMDEKDAISWKNIAIGFIENGQLRRGIRLFSVMRASGFDVDELILRNVIGVCSGAGELTFGLGLHCLVIKCGLLTAISVATSLLKMYADSKDVDAAETLFHQLNYKDNVAWSAMVSVYSQSEHPKLALELFKQMESSKQDANEITLVCLLQACSAIEAHKLGRSIHAHVIRSGFNSNMYINSTLIDLYCKAGRLRQGKAAFDTLPSKDLVCWSSMIKGYGIHGHGKEAIETFNIMLKDGLMPNEVVFVSLLSACSHCHLLQEGWKWFYSMKERFGISPTSAHYNCMVDVLGRHGEVEKAVELIKGMPFKPDASVWGSLLSWCRTTGDVRIAEAAMEQLMRLDMNNTSCFVMLGNMYSQLGQWKAAERIRELMELNGRRKIAGYSMID